MKSLLLAMGVLASITTSVPDVAVVTGCTANPSGSYTWTSGTFGQDGYQEVTSYPDGTIDVWEIGVGWYAEGWDQYNQIGHFFLDDDPFNGPGSSESGYYVDEHFQWANGVWYNAFQAGCVP